MRWFRTNRRLSGTLALLALALQIALAFGHIHLRDVAGASGAAFSQARATIGDQTGDRNTGRATDDYCLICASISLAGTLVPPSQDALARPLDSSKTSHRHFRSTSYSHFEHALFHARAPPLV